MLDLTVYHKQYYEIKVSDTDILHLESPTRKQLKKLMELTKSLNQDNLADADIDMLYEAATMAINKNKENRSYNADQIDVILPFKALEVFFNKYYTWITDNVDQKN